MKPFRFKLKTVLEVRVNEEVQAGEVYAPVSYTHLRAHET